MSVVVCSFAGWVQVRLATNPDPADEPRGISGYSFALPGEPDLDRVVRTSHPVAPRSHGPAIGLAVRAVTIDGFAVPAHPLLGARVDLLGAPVFESVNDVVMPGGVQALEPFDLAVTHGHGRFRLRRRDYLDPARPELTVYTAPPALLAARRTGTVTLADDLLVEATGAADAPGYRAARLALLRADLAASKDPVAAAALGRRIRELELDDPRDRRTLSMTFIERRSYQLNGPLELDDPDGWLATLVRHVDYPCDLTMGVWDADALSAYTTGTLTLPLD